MRAASDPDPGSLFMVGDHRRIRGRIQPRAHVTRYQCFGGICRQPGQPEFRFIVE
jgi:hypothetical protein